MHHYSKHIGDYRRDTTHLSMLEHGAYNQLLDWAYLDEKPIPRKTDLVFRRLRAVTDDEKNAVMTVLEEFFEETDDGFRHKRVEAELRLYEEKAERARKNGQKGGRPPSPDAGGDEPSSSSVGNGSSGNSMTYADDRNRTSGVSGEKPTDNRLGFSGLSPETQKKTNHEPLTINQEPITKRESTRAPVRDAPPPPDGDAFPDDSANSGAKPETAQAPRAAKKPRKPVNTPIAEDFAISDRVRRWAAAQGVTELEAHFEHFVTKCKAKGYEYADWDAAFMGAIRDNWRGDRGKRFAGSGGGGARASPRSSGAAAWVPPEMRGNAPKTEALTVIDGKAESEGIAT